MGQMVLTAMKGVPTETMKSWKNSYAQLLRLMLSCNHRLCITYVLYTNDTIYKVHVWNHEW